jgi:hypothetical protein
VREVELRMNVMPNDSFAMSWFNFAHESRIQYMKTEEGNLAGLEPEVLGGRNETCSLGVDRIRAHPDIGHRRARTNAHPKPSSKTATRKLTGLLGMNLR